MQYLLMRQVTDKIGPKRSQQFWRELVSENKKFSEFSESDANCFLNIKKTKL